MIEINYYDIDIEINNNYIKKIEKQIKDLDRRIQKYKEKNKELEELK